jgi:hypothetical protein
MNLKFDSEVAEMQNQIGDRIQFQEAGIEDVIRRDHSSDNSLYARKAPTIVIVQKES